MISRLIASELVLIVSGFLLAGPAQGPTSSPASPPPELAELLKLGEPSEKHRELDVFVGQWEQTVRCWVRSDAPPIESSMTAEYAWVLDGRFIQGRLSGTMFGRPFHAIEIRGFDTFSGCFTLQWMDNMGTAALLASGQFDPQSRVYELNGLAGECRVIPKGGIGSASGFRTATHLVGSDRMIFEIFSTTRDGQEFRSLQVISARRGS